MAKNELDLQMEDYQYLPLRDVVFRTLRQAILRGELKPGERLMEIRLANQLGVSRTPIREAIRMLELDGLVIMVPRKGAQVAQITEKDLNDVLEVRLGLEELAVKLACQRITESELQKLYQASRSFEQMLETTETDDLQKLAQADVAVAMNTGTQAAKEAGNMVDLDSSPTKLIDIVRIGKQLLMTRGSLTTFSIANDVAKYFAIIPALFMGLYPRLSALNIMGLHSPQSAVLSAIIYNALIIIVLIPLALKGVKYREVAAGKLLSRNLLVYGLGGLAAPFIFVKLIDVLLVFTGLV